MKGKKLVQLLLRCPSVRSRKQKLATGFCAKLRQSLLSCVGVCRAVATNVPYDVPPGHLAVYAGLGRKRFVIRVSYLNHSVFRALLDEAKEVYGFDPQLPLTFPCDENTFEYIIHLVCMKEPDSKMVVDEHESDPLLICQLNQL